MVIEARKTFSNPRQETSSFRKHLLQNSKGSVLLTLLWRKTNFCVQLYSHRLAFSVFFFSFCSIISYYVRGFFACFRPYSTLFRSRSFYVKAFFVYIVLYTVKPARAKLPANAGNFTWSSQIKRSLAQFTCVTCSLLVNTGKFTCLEAASTSRRTHANYLRAHVNLPEYHRHFTGSFTCGTHANLPATSMQNCLLLQAKIHATYRQKHWNRR